MNKKEILFTIISGFIALLAQTRMFTSWSVNRLAAASVILFFMLLFCVCWIFMARTRPDSFRSQAASIWALLSLTAALFMTALCILTSFRLENQALATALIYISQMLPLLLFLGLNTLCFSLLVLHHLRAVCQCGMNAAIRQILSNGRIVWQAALLFAACMILFLPYIPIRANYYPSHDYSIFAYIGQQILKGKIPYTQLWDHKPPLIFYLNALALFLSNGKLIGIWILEILALFSGSLLFFKVLCRRFAEWLSLSVTMLGILHFARLFDFGNYTEEFSLFFQLCALALWFTGNDKNRLNRALFSGLLCGLAFTCKQNTIGCWAAIFILELLRTKYESNTFFPRYQISRLGLFLSGFLAINLIWVVYFAAKGALHAYWEVAFQYNFLYAEQSGASRLATALTTLTFLPGISPFLCIGFLSWISLIIIQIRSSRNMERLLRQDRLILWSEIALGIELVFAGLSGMNYQHYFILCIPPVCVMICWFGECLNSILSRRFKARISICLIVAFLSLCSLPLLRVYRASYEPRMPSAYTKTAAFLSENTREDDPILVWGSRSAIYIMTGLGAPTAYFNERPLYLFSNFVEAAKWEEFLRDIEKTPPKYIIDTGETQLPFISQSADSCDIPNAPDYRIPTYTWFCAHYERTEIINEGMNDEWLIYTYKD